MGKEAYNRAGLEELHHKEGDMNIDEFLELVRKRRSIRAFKPDPVPDECIEKVLEAARWAQSGSNAQPWEFIVVKDKDIRNRITEILSEKWKRSWDIEKTRIAEVRHQNYLSENQGPRLGFKDAPVFIVVCGDPRTVQASVLIANFLPEEGGPQAIFFKDVANATQILHLAVAAYGLGSQWISINYTSEAALKELLGVPVELSVHTVVPVGYPAYEPPPSYRRELREILHYEKYDRSKYRSGDDIFDFLVKLRKHLLPAYPAKSGF